MNDQQFISALASMSEKDLTDFCTKVCDNSITLDTSYDNYISLSLLLIKYFYSGTEQENDTATHN